MCGRAIETQEHTIRSRGPSRTCIGTIKTECVGGGIFEFTELGIFGACGDADLAFAGSGDASVGLDVSRHGDLVYFILFIGSKALPTFKFRSASSMKFGRVAGGFSKVQQ